MPDPFRVVDVSSWTVAGVEPGGQDEKRWLRAPDEVLWLYKPATVRPDRRQGEDWAEKVAAELASRLGVPAADVEMASRSGIPGSLSRDLKPGEDWEMHVGAVLISGVDPRIRLKSQGRIGHNLTNIERVLTPTAPPRGYAWPSDFNAYSVFCGYLLFDAWVANQDRHEANWSVLVSPSAEVSLAGSYDHGSSLGFSLTDSRRRAVIEGHPGVEVWAGRGKAHRFEDGQRLSLVQYAAEALTRASDGVREWWLDRLAAAVDVGDLVEATPEVGGRAYVLSTLAGRQPEEAARCLLAALSCIPPEMTLRLQPT